MRVHPEHAWTGSSRCPGHGQAAAQQQAQGCTHACRPGEAWHTWLRQVPASCRAMDTSYLHSRQQPVKPGCAHVWQASVCRFGVSADHVRTAGAREAGQLDSALHRSNPAPRLRLDSRLGGALVVGVGVGSLLVGQLILSQDGLPRDKAAVGEERGQHAGVDVVPRAAQCPRRRPLMGALRPASADTGHYLCCTLPEETWSSRQGWGSCAPGAHFGLVFSSAEGPWLGVGT